MPIEQTFSSLRWESVRRHQTGRKRPALSTVTRCALKRAAFLCFPQPLDIGDQPLDVPNSVSRSGFLVQVGSGIDVAADVGTIGRCTFGAKLLVLALSPVLAFSLLPSPFV